jgi:hypothetical protein
VAVKLFLFFDKLIRKSSKTFFITKVFVFRQYHKHDLTLARTMGDRLGEAKASGNLGNTLKVMGKFEEAVICCRRHLEICQEHSDQIGIGRALYNLGNVYHAKVSFNFDLLLTKVTPVTLPVNGDCLSS